MYDYLLEDNQQQNAIAYDACNAQNVIEWNGTSFTYTREDGEIFFCHKQILEYQWEEIPNPTEDDNEYEYQDSEWYLFQLHCWKVLGKPEQIVDCTFPFLAFEEPEPKMKLEDIPIEYF